MSKRRTYQALGDVELPPELAAKATAAIEQAERDLSEEVRVNFRWGAAQLNLVRRAADLAGVPYQSYLKQVAIRQAMADLKEDAALRGG